MRSRVEQAQFYILLNKPLASKLLVMHHSVVTEQEQRPMEGSHNRRAEDCSWPARAETTVRGLGSQTCWEVVTPAAWMLRCFMTVEMRKQVSCLLAPAVFITKSLIVSLCPRQMWFPVFSGWLSVSWFSLFSLIPSTFQMAKPWIKWF